MEELIRVLRAHLSEYFPKYHPKEQFELNKRTIDTETSLTHSSTFFTGVTKASSFIRQLKGRLIDEYDDINIGHTIDAPEFTGRRTKIFADHSTLTALVSSPWFFPFLKHRFDLDLNRTAFQSQAMYFPFTKSRNHNMNAFICGKPGSGKSRLMLHLLREQLKAGCSAVVMDIKEETIRQCLQCALDAGFTKKQITVIYPSNDERGIPGWNPLLTESKNTRSTATNLIDLLKDGDSSSYGPRMLGIFTELATVVAHQGLSILELYELLQDPYYLEGFIDYIQSLPSHGKYAKSYQYVIRELKGLLKEGSSAEAVKNKFRLLESDPYLGAMLTAEEDHLDLPSLWNKPRIILVHLNELPLGKDHMGFLANLFAYHLYQTAMSNAGPNPVVFFLDEVPEVAQYMEKSLLRIMSKARSGNLRLLAACQYVDQLSTELKAGLLNLTSFQAFFTIDQDASMVAKSLGMGKGGDVTNITLAPVDADAKDTPVAFKTQVMPLWAILKETGQWDRVDFGAYGDKQVTRFNKRWHERKMGLIDQKQYAEYSQFPFEEFEALLEELGYWPEVVWLEITPDSGDYHNFYEIMDRKDHPSFTIIRGKTSSASGITFAIPHFKIKDSSKTTEAERIRQMEAYLKTLPKQHAVVKTSLGSGVIKTLPIPFAETHELPAIEDYLGNGQTTEEIAAVRHRRESRIAAMRYTRPDHDAPPTYHKPRPQRFQPKPPNVPFPDFGIPRKLPREENPDE